MTVITLITCVSLIGRNTIGTTLVGDYELTAAAAGAAVALFLPWCQLRRENIIVDFFTAKLAPSVNQTLDRFGALLLSLIFMLLAWRSSLGGINVWQANSETQIMGFPEWVVYAFMVPAFVLTALIALRQAVFGFGGIEPDDPVASEKREA